MIEEKFASGTPIWVPHNKKGWTKGVIVEFENVGKSKFKLKFTIEGDGEKLYEEIYFNNDDKSNQPYLRNTTLNEDRIDDLTTLSYLTEPAVLNTIKARYLENQIYTYSGLVLVSLNPYCKLPLYGDELIQAYSGKSKNDLEPHLFAVAEDAFRSMVREGRNQSIIISGESGAGKTISAKHVMRYFAAVDANTMEDSNFTAKTTKISDASLVESQVLSTNPILEAFGNAKTTRNDNSSRFGKYVQIYFDSNPEIIGAEIRTYLLEKSRVAIQSRNERNYHIFYQLLAGISSDHRQRLYLDSMKWSDFHYLRQGNCGVLDKVDDSDEFVKTESAMKIANFSSDSIFTIYQLLAAILFLGNTEIRSDEEGKGVIHENDPNLIKAAQSLSVNSLDLSKALTTKLLITKVESILVQLTVEQAITARDSVSKFLYSQLFKFIVKRLNSVLKPSDDLLKKSSFIGVLDIYGFEKFDRNSFEQFCINYANEKLQYEFNQQVFKLEQDLYKKEEINWSFINFYDNQPCIDMIEIRGGILSLLDEECRFPNGCDQSFLDKILKLVPNQKTEFKDFLYQDKISNDTFSVKHFAYDVAYHCETFLEKNRDLIPLDAVSLLDPQHDDNSVFHNFGDFVDFSKLKSGKSTGLRFKESLSQLMTIIKSTDCHYIRCIKPNQDKEALSFDPTFVLQQLRAGGIIETIRISAAGYPARWIFEEFYRRYRVLEKADSLKDFSKPETGSDYRARAKKLLETVEDLTNDQFQLARLEKLRTNRLNQSALLIQKIFKSFQSWSEITQVLKGVRCIQKAIQSKLARIYFQGLREEDASNKLIRAFKAYIGHQKASCCTLGTLLVQSLLRSKRTRAWYRRELEQKSALSIQTIYRVRRQLAIKSQQDHSSNLIKNATRLLLAKKILSALQIEARSVEKLTKTSFELEQRIIQYSKQQESLLRERNSLALKVGKLENEANSASEKISSLQQELRELQIKRAETSNNSEEYSKLLELFKQKDSECDGLKLRIIELEQTTKAQNGNQLHQLKDLKQKYEKDREELRNQIEKELSEKTESCKALMREKKEIELKYRKIEKFVRQLMSNRISAAPVANNLRKESSLSRRPSTMEQEAQASSTTSLLLFVENNTIDPEDREKDEDVPVETTKLIKIASSTQSLIDLLKSEIILDEMILLIQESGIVEFQDLDIPPAQETILLPSRIIYSWLVISLNIPELMEMTEERLSLIISTIRDTLSESSDDRKCSYWLTNLVHLLSLIQFLISSQDKYINSTDPSVVEGENDNTAAAFSLSILLIARAELTKLIEDIYLAWCKELCRWFGNAGVSGILDHQELPNYRVSTKSKSDTPLLIRAVLKTLGGAQDDNQNNFQMSISSFLAALDDLVHAFLVTTLDVEIVQRLLVTMIEHISVTVFNQFLLRKSFSSWKRAIQIQFNISRLEEWLSDQLPKFGISDYWDGMGKGTGPLGLLMQAVKVTQVTKSGNADLNTMKICAPDLNFTQIRRIISNYVPEDYEEGLIPSFIVSQLPNSLNDQLFLPAVGIQRMSFRMHIPQREPPKNHALSNALPIDMPPTLWKLFILYSK